jgi:hypothetical protein
VRFAVLACTLLLLAPPPACAEWQIKPFFGVTFGGGTTFIDLEQAVGSPNPSIGVSGVLLGEVIGVEGDFAYAPGFFQSGDQHQLVGSGVTTLTGNVVVAMPGRQTRYTLRPYFVAGGGMMHARIDLALGAVQGTSTLPVFDVGGGVTGFLTNDVGLSWDVRYFRSGEGEQRGLSFGAEQLSFWRANMAVAVRF